MKKRYVAILMLIAAVLVSCGKPTRSGVPGTYRAEYSYGTEQIRLDADGTFEQQFSFKSGSTVSNTGTWKGPDDNGQMVMLNFICFDDGFGTPRPNPHPGPYALAFEAQGMSVSLRFNKGLGEVYRKQ